MEEITLTTLVISNITALTLLGLSEFFKYHAKNTIKLLQKEKIFYQQRAREKECEANNLRLRINHTINKPYI